MLSDRRRRKGAQRTRPGNGRPLEPFRWWHLLSGRKLFSLELLRPNGRRAGYAVDVRVKGNQAGDFGMVHLYLDGRHHAESPLPAAVPVEGGVIEVVLGLAGLPVAEHLGHFASPLRLPLWLNIALGLGAGFAATERALRLKFHWLLDGAGT